MTKIRRPFGSFRAFAAPFVLAVLAVLTSAGCARFFFFPDHVARMQPGQLGLEYRDVYFDSFDGVRLHGWMLPAKAAAGEAAGTVVFLHGNAQNVTSHIASVYWLPAAGFNVFLFDYRGYGSSKGHPTIADVHRDAEAAIRHAPTLPGVDATRIAVFGQSLGGAIAPSAVAHLRGEVRVRALVLDSAFSNFRDVAREKLGGFWLTWPLHRPLALTVPDDERPLDALASLAGMPVVIVHGEADDVIPVEHARRLHGAVGPDAELWIVPGAGHIEAFRDARMRDRLAAFLAQTLRAPAGG